MQYVTAAPEKRIRKQRTIAKIRLTRIKKKNPIIRLFVRSSMYLLSFSILLHNIYNILRVTLRPITLLLFRNVPGTGNYARGIADVQRLLRRLTDELSIHVFGKSR